MAENKIYACPVIGIDTTELLHFAQLTCSSSAAVKKNVLQSLQEAGKYGTTKAEIQTYFGQHLFACQPCRKEYLSWEEMIRLININKEQGAKLYASGETDDLETILKILYGKD